MVPKREGEERGDAGLAAAGLAAPLIGWGWGGVGWVRARGGPTYGLH